MVLALDARGLHAPQTHHPAAVVGARVVDRPRRDPPLEPDAPSAALEHPRGVPDVLAEQAMSFVLVHESPDDRAPGRIGARVEIADLVEEQEDLLAWAGPDTGGRRRGGRDPPPQRRVLALAMA